MKPHLLATRPADEETLARIRPYEGDIDHYITRPPSADQVLAEIKEQEAEVEGPSVWEVLTRDPLMFVVEVIAFCCFLIAAVGAAIILDFWIH